MSVMQRGGCAEGVDSPGQQSGGDNKNGGEMLGKCKKFFCKL